MESKIFRINKAGLCFIGHYRMFNVDLHVENPDMSGTVELTIEKTAKLLGMLDVEYKDGDFLQDILEGQYVLVCYDDNLRIKTIGDPYGNDCIEIGAGDV